jgi:MFS family permease
MPASDAPVPGKARAERVLDVLGFVLADVRYGLGPYGVVYLIGLQGWDEADIALAFGFGGLAGLVSQAPIGALVDRVRSKRALAAAALLLVAGACLAIPLAPGFWPVALAGVAGALANVTLGTTLAAISLGVVGPARFARRAARNEVFFHAGSAAVNLAVLGLAPLFGIVVVFWLLAGAALLSLLAVAALPAGAVDAAVARGLEPGAKAGPGLRALAGQPGLLAFAGCGALFHMANASMLALMLQRAARLNPEGAVALAAASMIAAQVAMIGTAMLAGMRADRWGRRPFFVAAFLALALRGVIFASTTDPAWIVAAQLLDGVGVGVFGALFPVLIADLTRGRGHFGAAQGLVGTAHGMGGLIGGPASAACVVLFGYGPAFLLLAGIAACGALAFTATVAETARSVQCAGPTAARRKLLRHR